MQINRFPGPNLALQAPSVGLQICFRSLANRVP
jgi:hypothetical protein